MIASKKRLQNFFRSTNFSGGGKMYFISLGGGRTSGRKITLLHKKSRSFCTWINFKFHDSSKWPN